jgi:hypothetical protein
MRTKRSKIGSTLVEVLVSFAILSSTGVLVVGFLFRNPMSNKVWIDNYGQELSKIILLTTPIANDTIVTHTDESGNTWETVVKVSSEQEESCFKAVSIRRRQDTTRTLHYCNYGAKK